MGAYNGGMVCVVMMLLTPILRVQSEYTLLSFRSVSTGWAGVLQLSSPGPYGNDINYVALDIVLFSNESLRMTLRDATQPRWEIPAMLLPGYTTPTAVPANPLYTVTTSTAPFRISIRRRSSNELIFSTSFSDLVYSNQYLRVNSSLPRGHTVYGLGERVAPLRLPLQTYTIETNDFGGNPMYKGLYGHHPLYMRMEDDGSAHIVMLWNSNAMDVTLGEEFISYQVTGGVIDLFFFLGPSPLQTIEQYTTIIGKPFMPPLWSIGYHQCRWGYRTANVTLQVAQNFSLYKMPLDTMWQDIDWMEDNFAFTFAGQYDGNRFSTTDVIRLNDYLRKGHMHHVYINDCNVPAVLKDYGNTTYYPYTSLLDAGAYVLHPARDLPLFGVAAPGVNVVWPDWTNPAIDHWLEDNIAVWSRDVGLPDGLWLDMNEPSAACPGQILPSCEDDRSTSGLFRKSNPMEKSENRNQQSDRVLDPRAVPHPQVNLPTDLPYPPYLPGGQALEQRSFNISSYHYIGRHFDVKPLWGRFEQRAYAGALSRLHNKRSFTLSRSTFMGSGSSGSHWTGDNYSTVESLTYSIAAIIAMGIYGVPMTGADVCGFNYDTTAKLCARWMQVGMLYPFSRNHDNTNNIDQEPYRFGEPYTSINRNALLLRYSLLPYLYTLFANAHMTGHPLWRAMSWEFPQDRLTWSIDRQVMIGSALLVVPIVEDMDTIKVTGYIPEGDWFNYHSFGRYPSAQNHTFTCTYEPTSLVPLLIRGGYIVPSQIPQLTTYDTWTQPYTLRVALDSKTNSSKGHVIIDDGESINALELKQYNRLDFFAQLQYLRDSRHVYGYVQMIVTQNTTFWPLDKYTLSNVYVLGLSLDNNYDPSTQPLCIQVAANPCTPLQGAVSVVGETLLFSGSFSMSQTILFKFGETSIEQPLTL